MKYEPVDAEGGRIRVGDTVRVLGVPDLSGMGAQQQRESSPVFECLVGKRQLVDRFDEYGLVWLQFAIPRGIHKGWHAVAMEPYLLKVVPWKPRGKTSNKLLMPTPGTVRYSSHQRGRRGTAKR
jgi:hypothetical protein